ncbi:MAG TPA: hypothetical protein VNY33_02040 [Gaiellaceae bacterium]|nr:hypothetical protein [Gaiellaceae bacterium]
MTPFPFRSPAQARAIALNDRLCVRDGRIGEVIGFYRREAESVLLRFKHDECGQFLVSDVVPTWIGWD